VQVHNSVNELQLPQQSIRESAVGYQLLAHHLHVDGLREPEVEDLADHVRSQDVEGDARIFAREAQPQPAHVLGAGMMIVRERHQDVGIAGADGRRRAVGEINGAIGQSDIVYDARQFAGGDFLADRIFHQVAQTGGFFDASAGRSAQMEGELAGINPREEVLTDPGQKQE
jgi:hypothetical protein